MVPLPATVVVRAELDARRSEGRKRWYTAKMQLYSTAPQDGKGAGPAFRAKVEAGRDGDTSGREYEVLKTGPVCATAEALFVVEKEPE